MFSPNNPYFSLSEEGEKEFGHIFPGDVPIKRGHLIMEASGGIGLKTQQMKAWLEHLKSEENHE